VAKEEGRGRLVIIGGHEDKRGPRTCLEEFVRLAGGREARVAIVTTAASDEEAAFDTYRSLFLDMGAGEVLPLRIQSRREALQPSSVDVVKKANAFFFTGGDQLRITSALGGTPVHAALAEAHRAGAVVGGTSAGASMMTAVMIVEGEGDASPSRSDVRMSPGMGFLRDAVVDQHFAQRGRIGRLFSVVAQNPKILGIGIDEDTAVVVEGAGGTIRVVGSNTVTIVDGRSVTHTTVSEGGGGNPFSISDLIVHVLARGYRLDLATRRPHPPSGHRVNRQKDTAKE